MIFCSAKTRSFLLSERINFKALSLPAFKTRRSEPSISINMEYKASISWSIGFGSFCAFFAEIVGCCIFTAAFLRLLLFFCLKKREKILIISSLIFQ